MSGLTFTVLGCSGSYASAEVPCSGYLVRSEHAAVLLDCGPGTLGPLQTEIDLAELTAVVLTHCHPDHWLELPVLRNVFTWFEPRTDVPVYGTAETHSMDSALTVRSAGREDPLRWEVIDAMSRLTIGDQRWRFSQTDHPVETLAVRVDVGDSSVAFSSDTGPGWTLEGLGPGIGTAVLDASHTSAYEDRGIPHLSAREAAIRAEAAGVERLVLTHLVPGSDPDVHRAEARAAYGGPVEVARPGLRLEI